MKNKINLSPKLLTEACVVLASALALFSIYKGGLNLLNWSSVLVGLLLGVLAAYQLLKIRRKIKLDEEGVRKQPEGVRKQPTHSDSLPTHKVSLPKNEVETNRFKSADVRKLKNQIRDSLAVLDSILSSHSIVLYVRGKDGLFEIEDFISRDEKYIDKGQKFRLRSGYFGWVIRTKTPILVGSIKNRKDNLIYYTRDIPVNSIFISPLVVEDDSASEQEPAGVLVIDSLEQNAFGEKERQIVSLVSGRVSEIIGKFQLSEKVLLSSLELASFHEFTNRLSDTLELDATLDHVVATTAKVLGADAVGITLLRGEKDSSTLMQVGGERREEIEGKAVPHYDTLVGLVTKSGRYFHSDNLSARSKHRSVFGKEVDFALGMQHVKSVLIYPLRETKDQEREKILGCIVIGRKRENSFSEIERSLASMMSQEAAKAISNSFTYLKVKELAIKDGLTGLYNHRHFQEMLSNAIARSDRFPEKVSLILIDVDNLKQLNDSHGHQAADVVLASIGLTISQSLRKIDMAARYGGDEFAVILPNTNSNGAKVVSEKIRQKIQKISLKFKGEELKVSVSIGTAVYPQNATTKDSLIERADRALYEAKRGGRNRVVHYEDIFPNKLVRY